jgi:hypothetical protein
MSSLDLSAQARLRAKADAGYLLLAIRGPSGKQLRGMSLSVAIRLRRWEVARHR